MPIDSERVRLPAWPKQSDRVAKYLSWSRNEATTACLVLAPKPWLGFERAVECLDHFLESMKRDRGECGPQVS